MLYEALAGRLPFDGPPGVLLREKEKGSPIPPYALDPGIPADLDALVMTMLRPEPTERPGADEIAARLRGVVAPIEGAHARPKPVSSMPFVGRAEELELLRSRQREVAPGHPVVVHVRGASGIGKSELVRHFLQLVQEDGRSLVLSGRCGRCETGRPAAVPRAGFPPPQPRVHRLRLSPRRRSR